MTNINWANDASGTWETATNWNGGAVPGSGDYALLKAPGGAPYTVTLTSQAAVKGIELDSNATLKINSSLTISNGTGSGANYGSVDVFSGALFAKGVFDNIGTLSVAGGYVQVDSGVLSLTGGGFVGFSVSEPIGNGNVLTGSGTIKNVDNHLSGQFSIDGVAFINEGSGVVMGVRDMYFLESNVTNYGTITFNCEYGGIISSPIALNNSGTINNEMSTLNIGGNLSIPTVVNSGLLEATSTGNLNITYVNVFGASGVILVGAGDQATLQRVGFYGGVLETSGTGEFLTTDSLSVLNGVASTLTNKGHFDVATSDTLGVTGAIANTGTLSLASKAGLSVQSAGVTFSGAGQIELSADGTDTISAAAPGVALANANTISGTGTIASGVELGNLAGGVIDANGPSGPGYALVIDCTLAANTGLIEATGSASLDLHDLSLVNMGGTVSAAGGSVFLQGATIVGGTVKSSGGGLVHVQPGANVLDGTTSAISLSGTLILNNGASVTGEGTIANAGTLTVNSAGAATTLVVGAAGLTLTGKGRVLLGANAHNLITGGVLTNQGNLIFGAGDIGDGAMSLINAGTITATDSTPLILDTGAATIVNSGTISSVAGGVGEVMSGVENDGLLLANGGSLTVNGAVTGTGRVNIRSGTLTMASSFNEIVSFIGTTGAVALADSQAFTNLVYGFSTTGATSLDLEDIAFGGSTTASFSGTTKGGVLTVTDGTHTASIHLQGNYTASTFTASSDGHGGTTVVDPPAGAAPLSQAMAAFAAPGAAQARLHAPPPRFAWAALARPA